MVKNIGIYSLYFQRDKQTKHAMKKRNLSLAVAGLFLVTALASCSSDKEGEKTKTEGEDGQETATPEGFVKAFCTLGEGEVSTSKLEKFYDTDAVLALTGYEEALTENIAAFDAMVSALKERYGDSIQVQDGNVLELTTIGEDGEELSFTLAANGGSILAQMQEMKPGCAELVSYDGDEEGGTITLKMANNSENQTFEVRKSKHGLVIVMSPEELEQFGNFAFMFRNYTHLYTETVERLKSAEGAPTLKALSAEMYRETQDILLRL
jgi:hypothetical protein